MEDTINMEEALSDLRLLLLDQPGYYFTWKGFMYNKEYTLPRLDNIYLDVIYSDEEENPFYRRSPACSLDNGRSQVLFSGRDTYRVTDVTSLRYGRNFHKEDLPKGEKRRRRGLLKKLEITKNARGFKEEKRLDMDAMPHLYEALYADPVDSLERCFPEIYLTLPAEDAYDMLRLRKTKESRLAIENTEGYDGTLKSAIEAHSINAGGNRIGVPYKYFLGSGVLCADYSEPVFGKWYYSKEMKVETPHFAIRHF